MKRWLFNVAAVLSLLLLHAAVVAWAMSYTRPGWRLIGTAHSADLTRVNSERGTALFTTTPTWSKSPNHGFWDAVWALNRSGRLTILAQAIDYDGTLRRVHVSPPMLVVELPGQRQSQATVFAGVPGPSSNRLGFGRQFEAQVVGGVSARAHMVTVPWWLIVLLSVPAPLAWLRSFHRLSHEQ